MAHSISGFIAPAAQLSEAAVTLQAARIFPLPLGFCFLPIVKKMVEPKEPASAIKSFYRLPERLEKWAIAQSNIHPIVYIETEFFGGIGSQAAILWSAGVVKFGPFRSDNEFGKPKVPLLDHAINCALRQLGVQRGEALDEFEALGIGRFRNNDDWIGACREE